MNKDIKGISVSSLLCVLISLSVSIKPAAAQTVGFSLPQAIEKALSQSPKIAAAKASLNADRGALLQAAAMPNPELGITAENIAGNGMYRGTDAGELTYSISQKVEIGKRPARRNKAMAELDAATIKMLAQQREIIRDVKIAYVQVLAAGKAVEIATRQENLAADVLADVSKRVGAARDPLIYKSQAEVTHITAKLSQAQAERDLTQARKRLENLWGGDPMNKPLDSEELSVQAAPGPLEDYSKQLSANADLMHVSALKAAKQEAVTLEKAQSLPDPSVNFGVRTFRENDARAMVVGISMPIPVFDQNEGNVAKARAEVSQLESEIITARLEAEQALLEAWQTWDASAREASELAGKVIPAAQKSYSLAREGYDRGRFAYLEILNAQRTLSEAQDHYNQALLRQAVAHAEVEFLTGSSSYLNPTSAN